MVGIGGSASESKLTDDFYVKLMGFRDRVELDPTQWPLAEHSLKRQELQWFVCRPENEDMIRKGFDQLTDYRDTLKKCISVAH